MKKWIFPRIIPTNQNQTLLLEILELLYIGERNTHTKSQETLDFKLAEPKQKSNFDESLSLPGKSLMV